MRTAIYIIWALIPIGFFLLALWAKLEKMSAQSWAKERAGDYFRQGLFVLVCVIISVAIDTYFLESLSEAIMPDLVPLWFYEIMLLPVVLYIGALISGPSKEIKISRAPRRSDPRKRK